MKAFKKIFLLFLVLFLTGCTTVCNFSINEDNTMSFNIQSREIAEFVDAEISEYDPDWETKIDQLGDKLLSQYKSKYPDLNLSYQKDYYNYYGYGNRTFNNLQDFKTSDFINAVFNTVNCIENGNLINISLSNLDSSILNPITSGENSVEINISLPYVVTSSNATSVDRSSNVYTWKLSKDVTSINIKYDQTRKYYETSNNVIKENKNSIIWVGIGVVAVLVIATIVIAIKSKMQK